jgi:hypothetical protein
VVGDAQAEGKGGSEEIDKAAVRFVGIKAVEGQQEQEGEERVHFRRHSVPPEGMGDSQRQRRQEGSAVRPGVAHAEQEEQADRPRAKNGGEEIHQPEVVDAGQRLQQAVPQDHIERVIPGGNAETSEGQGISGEFDPFGGVQGGLADLGQDEGFGRDHLPLQSNAVSPGQRRLQGDGIEGQDGQEE